MRKLIFIPIVVVLLGVGAFMFWNKKTEPQSAAMPGAQSQRTYTIARGDLNAMVSATGKIEPIDKVEVKSKASGQIMIMPVEEGDVVAKGALIARIDETDARNTYEQALADLDVAKATVAQTAGNVKRQEEMFKRGLLSQAEMDQVRLEEVRAKAQLVKAATEVATMEIRLKDSVVRSTITGIILQKNVEEGQIIASGINSVSGGTLIATVARMDSMYVYAEVDEVDIGQVRIGQAAKVVPDAFPEEVFSGAVLRIAPLATVAQNVTTFNVTVIVSNANRRLKAGMNATVDLTVADRREVLLIAKEAVKDLREIRAQMMAMNPADSSAGNRREGAPNDSARAAWRTRMAQQ
ncbi:MAG: efflux RND transporter periplasmic adaptor subunit, partial [candidate division KSB1 bacterium]